MDDLSDQPLPCPFLALVQDGYLWDLLYDDSIYPVDSPHRISDEIVII